METWLHLFCLPRWPQSTELIKCRQHKLNVPTYTKVGWFLTAREKHKLRFVYQKMFEVQFLPHPTPYTKNDAYREPIVHAYNILCNLETVHSFIILLGGFTIPGRGPLKPPHLPNPSPSDSKNNRSDYIFQTIQVT